jgi:thiosulfate/3-mercaptopyruvate sulfurtransferase
MSALVSCDWLNAHVNLPNLVILDATIPSITSQEPSALANVRIPGARFFDLRDVFSDQASDLPAMMPSEESFAAAARALGINQDSQVVVYDNRGIYSSARVWWMLRAMGHAHVAVLDGGLPEWNKLGLPTEPINEVKYPKGDFDAHFKESCVATLSDVKTEINNHQMKVIDARSERRFNGTAPEPRQGLRSGSIPNSINLPFAHVLHDGKMRPKDELQSIFEQLGISDEQLIFSCGSGVTACIILLAAQLAGFDRCAVYDGSWAEWGLIGE